MSRPPTQPLVVEFEVDAAATQAFELWTRRCATWWPSRHTITGDPASITFEPRRGGRIVERSPSGDEHDWGEILDWDPPRRLRYLWHLFFDRAEATEVEVTFTEVDLRTTVRVEQRGFERLGTAGSDRRERTRAAWAAITSPYKQACADAATTP